MVGEFKKNGLQQVQLEVQLDLLAFEYTYFSQKQADLYPL